MHRDESAPTAIVGPAVLPRSVPRHRRARRRGGGRCSSLLRWRPPSLRAARCPEPDTRARPGPPVRSVSRRAPPWSVGQPAPERHRRARRRVLPHAPDVAGPSGWPGRTRPHAGADVIVATPDGGTPWKAQHVTGGSTPQLSGISCPTRDGVHGGRVQRGVAPGERRRGDDHRRRDDLGAGHGTGERARRSTSVQCAATSDCTVVVSDGISTWSAHSDRLRARAGSSRATSPPRSSPATTSRASPGARASSAGYVPTSNGHGAGAIAVSGDGGQTWSLATVPTGAECSRAPPACRARRRASPPARRARR